MKKKGFIAGVVIGGLVFGSIGVFAGQYVATENTFQIKINGESANLEGYNIEGSTYFKLRDIGEYMGFDVDFQDNTILIGKNVSNTTPNDELFKDVDTFFREYTTKANQVSDANYEVIRNYLKTLNGSIDEMKKENADTTVIEKCNIIQTLIDKSNKLLNAMQEDAKMQSDRTNPNYIDNIFTSGENILAAYSDYLKAYDEYINLIK